MKQAGFTLIEIMISVAILSVILFLCFSIISNTEEVIHKNSSKIKVFTDAREAFYKIQKNLQQASLNTYWDYERNEEGSPISYLRKSELHFVSGNARELGIENSFSHGIFFFAPLGYTEKDSLKDLKNLMNARGYYISYTDNLSFLPRFLRNSFSFPKKYRFRLIELRIPAEENKIYDVDGSGGNLNELTNKEKFNFYRWFSDFIPGKNTYILADNICALIVTPLSSSTRNNSNERERNQIAPEYFYDTREREWGRENKRTRATYNRLPQSLRITLVAMTKDSANRLSKHGQESINAPNLGIENLFQIAENYEEDLEILEEEFKKRAIDYKIFSAIIPIKSTQIEP